MSSKLAFMGVVLTLLRIMASASGQGALKQSQGIAISDHVNFAPGGTIRIDGSYGDLTVDGWDRPEIEVNVVKSLPYGYSTRQPDRAAAHLDGVHIVPALKSAREATISTDVPARGPAWIPPFMRFSKGNVDLQYEIHVPSNSQLAIHHGTGLVSVIGITGDIEVTARRGDILMWLPVGAYAIDARTKLGIVSSDLDGVARNNHLIGEKFSRSNALTSHKLRLRMGFGGITLKEVLSESHAPGNPVIRSSYRYEPRITTWNCAKSSVTGYYSETGYDGLDRPRQATYSDGTPTMTYTYNHSGDTKGTLYYTHDKVGRVSGST